jgi:hypothetical protein
VQDELVPGVEEALRDRRPMFPRPISPTVTVQYK